MRESARSPRERMFEAMSVQDKLKELTLTAAEQNLLAGGFCPKCEVPIRGRYDPVKGWNGFAPEIYATLRENGIDINSGHKRTCELAGLRLP